MMRTPQALTFSSLYVLAFALFGAAWTIFSHAVVFSGGNFLLMQRYAPLVFLLWGSAAGWIMLRHRAGITEAFRALRQRSFYRDNRWVLAAIVLAYAITFLCYWDHDQIFYVSMAVFTLDHPDLPLLTQDTMLGYPIPFLSVPYRFASFELLAAYLGQVFSIHPVYFLHAVFPLFYVPLCLIGWYRLLDYFWPEKRKAGLLLVVITFLFMAETGIAPGDLALIRANDGKNVIYFAIIPLIYHYGITFLTTRNFSAWGMVFLLSIVALGLSSSALFLIPLQLAILSLLFLKAGWKHLVYCALLPLAGIYLYASGLWMRAHMDAPFAGVDSDAAFRALNMALYWLYTFGFATSFVLLICFLSLWRFFEDRTKRRLLLLLPLCIFILMFVPPLTYIVAEKLTSPWLFYRISWLLPIPVYLALFLLKLHERYQGANRAVVWIALAGVTLPFSIFSATNQMELRFALVKASTRLYETAEYIYAHQPEGTAVLGPEEVMLYLPWMHRHPALISGRHFLLEQANAPFGKEETEARIHLQKLVTDDTKEKFDASYFAQWVRTLHVGSITVREPEIRKPEMLETLRSLGFSPVLDITQPRRSTCRWCFTPGTTGDIHYQVWMAATSPSISPGTTTD